MRRQTHATGLAYVSRTIEECNKVLDDLNTMVEGCINYDVMLERWGVYGVIGTLPSRQTNYAMWDMLEALEVNVREDRNQKQRNKNHVLKMNRNHDEDEAWAS